MLKKHFQTFRHLDTHTHTRRMKMQVPCPICKKRFPIQLIEEHANVCIGDPTKKRKYAEQKLENVMSGTFETQRKQLRYHGFLYKISFNTLRVINSIYIGCGVAIFVLGCFAFVDEQKFNLKIPAGVYVRARGVRI